MIRVAAVGDLHFGPDSAGNYRPLLSRIRDHADVLLLAGDLTHHGGPAEVRILADELADPPVPVVGVLGNHDHHQGLANENRRLLEEAGVRILEGEHAILEIDGKRLGVAGAKGFCGGFAGACGTEFGEPEMKAFIQRTKEEAALLSSALDAIADCDVRVALTHYAPTKGTLVGEKLEIYPFLGSYLLGEAIDDADADLAVHGHAHRGTERGITAGGVHVRNVAMPLIRSAYRVFDFSAVEISRAAGDGAVPPEPARGA